MYLIFISRNFIDAHRVRLTIIICVTMSVWHMHGWFFDIKQETCVPDAPKAKSECGIIIIEISKLLMKKKNKKKLIH